MKTTCRTATLPILLIAFGCQSAKEPKEILSPTTSVASALMATPTASPSPTLEALKPDAMMVPLNAQRVWFQPAFGGNGEYEFTFPRIINNKLVIDFRAKEGSLVSRGYIHSGKYLGISIVATEKRDGRPNEVFKDVFFTETKPMRHQKKNYQTVMPVVTVSSSAFSDAIAKKITHVTLSVVETDGKPKKVFKTP